MSALEVLAGAACGELGRLEGDLSHQCSVAERHNGNHPCSSHSTLEHPRRTLRELLKLDPPKKAGKRKRCWESAHQKLSLSSRDRYTEDENNDDDDDEEEVEEAMTVVAKKRSRRRVRFCIKVDTFWFDQRSISPESWSTSPCSTSDSRGSALFWPKELFRTNRKQLASSLRLKRGKGREEKRARLGAEKVSPDKSLTQLLTGEHSPESLATRLQSLYLSCMQFRKAQHCDSADSSPTRRIWNTLFGLQNPVTASDLACAADARMLLAHHTNCKAISCPVCNPVRDIILSEVLKEDLEKKKIKKRRNRVRNSRSRPTVWVLLTDTVVNKVSHLGGDVGFTKGGGENDAGQIPKASSSEDTVSCDSDTELD